MSETPSHPHRRRPWFAALVVVSLLPAAFGLLGASAAQAAVTGVTCLGGTNTTTYSPGVTLTPTTQHITATSNFSTCSAVAIPALVTGSAYASLDAVQSCTTLARTNTFTFTIDWYAVDTTTLGTSVIAIESETVNDTAAADVITRVGVVQSGLFAGQSYVEVIIYAAVNTLLDCVGTGIQRRDSIAHTTTVGI